MLSGRRRPGQSSSAAGARGEGSEREGRKARRTAKLLHEVLLGLGQARRRLERRGERRQVHRRGLRWCAECVEWVLKGVAAANGRWGRRVGACVDSREPARWVLPPNLPQPQLVLSSPPSSSSSSIPSHQSHHALNSTISRRSTPGTRAVRGRHRGLSGPGRPVDGLPAQPRRPARRRVHAADRGRARRQLVRRPGSRAALLKLPWSTQVGPGCVELGD